MERKMAESKANGRKPKNTDQIKDFFFSLQYFHTPGKTSSENNKKYYNGLYTKFS